MKKILLAVAATVALSGCGSSSSGTVTLKGSTNSGSALAAVDAVSFKLKVYKAAVSTSTLCTDPITIYENSSPSYTTFDGSTFGTASLANGTYPCVMFEVSDTLKFTPSADSGAACTGGTEYTLEVCRSGTGSAGVLIDGSAFTCTDGEQRMAIYMSTASTETGAGDGSNPFEPPTSAAVGSDSTRGMKLNGAFTVSGTASASFIVDGVGIVDTNGSDCDMQPPRWGFQ